MMLHGVPADAPISVTGIGAVLPHTSSAECFWSHVRDGRSEISVLNPDRSEFRDFPVRLGAHIGDFDHRAYLPALPDRFAAKYSREILVVMSALELARKDAGVDGDAVAPDRMGIIASSSRGALSWWHGRFAEEHRPRPSFAAPDMLPGLPSMPASLAAIYGGIKGLVMTITSACVGGYQAIHAACRELESQAADVMFVIGYDFPLFRSMMEIYHANNLLSRRTGDPAQAMRPYDQQRDGFAFGEGAVVLVLERRQSALRRNARSYCDILGVGGLNEAQHPTSMDLTGTVTAGLVREVLQVSRRSLDQVDYFCGHGTATYYNDLAEGRAMAALYGGRSRGSWAPMSSIKPVYGHNMGAAGVVNVAASALMIHHQCLCPTINLEKPDPECDWDHVGEGPRPTAVDTIVSMSFAIGSQTAVVTLGREA